MNNQQVKAGHLGAIAVLLACAVMGFASGLDLDAIPS